MGGSPKTNSMVLAVDPRMMSQGIRHVGHLIAHEFFHTWGGERVQLPDELRWPTRASRTTMRTWSARGWACCHGEFAGVLAEQMQAAERNPQIGQLSLADAGGPRSSGTTGRAKLVYQGGLIIGAWLDRAIRATRRGKSLDDLMRAFVNDPRWRPAARSRRWRISRRSCRSSSRRMSPGGC